MALRSLVYSIGRGKTFPLFSCARTFSQNVSQENVFDSDLQRAFTSPEGKPIIAGRPFLPGSSGANMPPYLNGVRDDFPLVVDMTELASTEKISPDLATKAKAILQEKLPRFGGVLFKGLPLNSASDVSTFNRYMGSSTMDYQGGNGVRETVDAHVLTASREPPSYTIEPHNEMSYLSFWPIYISFFCDVPAEPGCGGESVLVANRDFQGEIDPEVKEKFKRLGIRYRHYYPGRTDDCYLSWQEVFKTDDKATAEGVMSDLGYKYEWYDDGSVSYWCTLPATRPHHKTGEEIWFNQVQCNASYFRAHPELGLLDVPDEKLPYHTYYGDGTEIHPDVIQHLRDVTWKHAIGVQLKKGEMVFLDNMLGQHGRLGFLGERRLLVTLFDQI